MPSTKTIKKSARRVAAATVASGLITAGALALGTTAASASTAGRGSGYSFRTIDNPRDLTFNQLLGINDLGEIAGYFGSGAQGHPNQGYVIPPFSHNFVSENFPGSVQTQVTGLNQRGVTVGFWSSMNNANQVNDNHGFVDIRGHFQTADFPLQSPAAPPVDQLLGINDSDVAVGFYTDANGINHGYEYDANASRFAAVTDPNAPDASLTAAAINDLGHVAGFYTNPATGNTDGFLLNRHGQFTELAVPGAASTSALGVNIRDEVVGVYSDAAGNMHGFTWTARHGFSTVDDPNGAGTTTINGVNDFGQLVGFYVDANGNTDGFRATP
jgi:uncharacterized membrane protein